MTSRPQISLSIASGDNGASAAHSTKGGGCFKAQFPGFGRDEVGDLVGFELPPHILDGIEFGSVSGQPFDHDASLSESHMIFHQGAAMDRIRGGALQPMQLPPFLRDGASLKHFHTKS